MSKLNRFFKPQHISVSASSPRSSTLRIEQLEDRLTPVVGHNAVLTPITSPSSYDGVVRIATVQNSKFSGSLIQTGAGWGFGHQILTVAHSIAKGPEADKLNGQPEGSDLSVRFDLSRAGNSIPITITIPKNVNGGAQYQIQHSGYQNNAFINDIGLLVLTDQVAGMAAPDRLLVAPYTAQQYTFYNGAAAEVGQQFTMVGYGRPGTGDSGIQAADDKKRAGQNRFDAVGTRAGRGPMTLMYDFDRAAGKDATGVVQPALDPLGVLLNINDPGLGLVEAFHAVGDSGGPAFLGKDTIVGVMSSIGALTPPDIDNKFNSTFGEIGFVTSASKTIGDTPLQGVLNPGGGAKYDLVLDMMQQVYGQSNAPGQAQDDLNITVQNVGGFLDIRVNGVGAFADAKLDGLYAHEPVANIKSLTLRGTGDNETFTIIGDLGIAGGVYIDGRAGKDEIVYTDSGSTAVAREYRLATNAEPGYTLRLNRDLVGQPVPLGFIDSKGISKYTLITGPGADLVNVEVAPIPVYIDTGDANDRVNVGTPGAGMVSILSKVFVDLGAGSDAIQFEDAANNNAGMSYTVAKSTATDWNRNWEFALRREQGAAKSPLVEVRQADRVELNTGAQGDLIQIQAAPAVDATQAHLGVFVQSNGGNDTVTLGSAEVGMAELAGPVRVDAGGQDGDAVVFEDAQSNAEGVVYTLSKEQTPYDYQLFRSLLGNPVPLMEAKGVAAYTLKAGKGSDTINVRSTPAAAKNGVTVSGGGGNDTISVGGANDKGLDLLLSPAYLFGDEGDDTLLIDNTKGSVKNFTLTKVPLVPVGLVTRGDGKSAFYQDFSSLNVKTDGGNANIEDKGRPDGTKLAFQIQGGSNVVAVGNDDSSLDGTGGPVAIVGATSTDRVTFTDAGFGGGATYTIRPNRFEAPRIPGWDFTYPGVGGAELTTGTGNDTVNLTGLVAAFAVKLDGNDGWDRFVVTSGTVTDPDVTNVEAGQVTGGTLAVKRRDLTLATYTQTGGTLVRTPTGAAGGATLAATEAVTLGGTLQLSLPTGFAAGVGTVLGLIDNRSSSPVTGTFSSLPEGAEVTANGWRFAISYAGTLSGPQANDVVLTVLTRSDAQILGTVYRDRTGNGRTADDAGWAGVQVYADTNKNKVLDPGEPTTTTDADGRYALTGLAPGSYTVRQVVPTAAVRTFPALSDAWAVSLTESAVVVDRDFANYQTCTDATTRVKNVQFFVNGTAIGSNLRNRTDAGDEITVTFTVTAGPPVTLSLVSYTAPAPTFDARTAAQQRISEVATGEFGPGTYSLTVHNPGGYFQVDFVCGLAIDLFGPAGSNIFYSAQKRLISADNG